MLASPGEGWGNCYSVSGLDPGFQLGDAMSSIWELYLQRILNRISTESRNLGKGSTGSNGSGGNLGQAPGQDPLRQHLGGIERQNGSSEVLKMEGS